MSGALGVAAMRARGAVGEVSGGVAWLSVV